MDLSLNSIQVISGLETLENLVSLDLSQNNIRKIEGLRALVSLRTLNLSDNKIQQIPGKELSPLVALSSLHLARNQIADLEELKQLAPLPVLSAVFFEGNPVSTLRDYLLFLVFHLPNLKQIDVLAVTTDHKQAALRRYAKAKTDTFVVRENLITYRKQMSELQEERQELLDQEILLNAQLQALDMDFNQINSSLSRSQTEHKDIQRLLACTPDDQLHLKQSQMVETLSHAEIQRNEVELVSKKLQESRLNLQTKEKQLETIRKNLRSRSPIQQKDDFLAAEEQHVIQELKEMRLAVQSLDRKHSSLLKEMQESMTKIEVLDKEIQGVKAGTAPWERTFDEETALYLPVRLREVQEEVEVWKRKLEQIRSKNVEILNKKTELELKREKIENSMTNLKEKIRENEVYVETGESPPRERPVQPHYRSEELRAWEAMRSLWRLISPSDLQINFTSLAATVIEWAEAFMKQLETKEKQHSEDLETVKRMGEAKYTCLQTEMKELERELRRYKQEKTDFSVVSNASSHSISDVISPDIPTLRESIRIKDERIEQLTHKQQLFEHMNSTLLLQIQEMTATNDMLSNQLQQVKTEPMKKEVQKLTAEISTYRAEYAVISEKSKSTHRQLAEATAMLEATSQSLSTCQQQLKDTEEELGLYLNAKHRKNAHLQVENAVKALAGCLGLNVEENLAVLAGNIAGKVGEMKEIGRKVSQFETEKKELMAIYERKFAEIKEAREKLSSEQMSFRKNYQAANEKLQEEKQNLQRICRSLRSQETRIRDDIDQHKDKLSTLNSEIAIAQRKWTKLQKDLKSYGQMNSGDLQESENSFVVLRSSPDIGFVSPAPKPVHRKGVSMIPLNRSVFDEERSSTVSTDRMYRPSPILRPQSSCSTSRMEENAGNERPNSLLKIENELLSLRQQLESFSLDVDPVTRQQTI